MPDDAKKGSVSKIPMGFGLSGYDFMKKKDTSSTNNLPQTSTFGMTADAIWGGGLVDDRWVADEKYKQVQIQTSIYQACPLIYNGIYNGKKGNIYGELTDAPHRADHNTDTGGGSFTGGGEGCVGARLFEEDVVGCTANHLSSKLTRWQNNLLHSKKPGRTEFYVGGAMSPHTLVAYFDHFYHISTNYDQVVKLLHTQTVCAEVVYRLSNTTAKAWRIKIIDSPGKKNGAKGTTNANGTEVFDYDILDICMAITLTKSFEQFCTYAKPQEYGGKKRWKQLNTGELMFPWYKQAYNYKNASIPGYGPTGIAEQNIVAWDITARINPVTSGIWHTEGRTPSGGLPIARARYFADPEDASTVRNVFPNMPNEFFETNFSDGGDADWTTSGIDLSQYSTVNEKILRAAEFLSGKIVSQNPHFTYSSSQFGLTGLGKGGPAYTPKNGCVDCDSFVNWVLLEVGVTAETVKLHDGSAWELTTDKIGQFLLPAYKALNIGTDISQAQPGDILTFGNGAHHAAIFAKFEDGNTNNPREYGFGLPKYVNGEASQPHGLLNGWRSKLTHITRIVKAKEDEQA